MGKRTNHSGRWIYGLVLLLALIMLLDMGVASADGTSTVDPVNQAENFSAVLYDNTNGLPTSEANAIVQTSEGFIWIGSYGGLIRYDGNTFVRIDSTSGITSIKCLYVDNQDRLWIGTNDNGVAVLEKGELRKWGKLDGMIKALNFNPDAKPEAVLSNVMHGIDVFVSNAEQFDDITMLCLKYNGPADRRA